MFLSRHVRFATILVFETDWVRVDARVDAFYVSLHIIPLSQSGASAASCVGFFPPKVENVWTGRSSLAFTMAEDDSDFCPKEDPKFNRFSFYIEKRAKEKLLEHQYEALVNLQEWFREGNPGEALVCMPTGTGKTGVMCCLPYFLEKIGM